jgi:hypothetical protein
MKAVYLAWALIIGMAAPALAEARVDLTVIVDKDFSARPTVDQAVAALETETPFCGVGWQVVMGHVGLGGNYAVDFIEESGSDWWLDWNAQAIYASFHLFEPKAFLDPYVEAGLGCSGQVYLGPSGGSGEPLAISLYPFVAAGLAVNFRPLRVGAQLSYSPWSSPIPVTPIPEFPLGAFQVSIFAGFGI